MVIIKKDGSLENFDINKLITSIKSAFSDCGKILNESDINYIRKTFDSKLTNFIKKNPDRIISSLEIKIFLFESLKECGFNNISKKYVLF